MHGFAQGGVASEGEREVADTAADVSVGKVLLDPLRCADEVKCIVVVLGDTCT